MNRKVSKKLRRYAKSMGAEYKTVKNVFKKLSVSEQKILIKDVLHEK